MELSFYLKKKLEWEQWFSFKIVIQITHVLI